MFDVHPFSNYRANNTGLCKPLVWYGIGGHRMTEGLLTTIFTSNRSAQKSWPFIGGAGGTGFLMSVVSIPNFTWTDVILTQQTD